MLVSSRVGCDPVPKITLRYRISRRILDRHELIYGRRPPAFRTVTTPLLNISDDLQAAAVRYHRISAEAADADLPELESLAGPAEDIVRGWIDDEHRRTYDPAELDRLLG